MSYSVVPFMNFEWFSVVLYQFTVSVFVRFVVTVLKFFIQRSDVDEDQVLRQSPLHKMISAYQFAERHEQARWIVNLRKVVIAVECLVQLLLYIRLGFHMVEYSTETCPSRFGNSVSTWRCFLFYPLDISSFTLMCLFFTNLWIIPNMVLSAVIFVCSTILTLIVNVFCCCTGSLTTCCCVFHPCIVVITGVGYLVYVLVLLVVLLSYGVVVMLISLVASFFVLGIAVLLRKPCGRDQDCGTACGWGVQHIMFGNVDFLLILFQITVTLMLMAVFVVFLNGYMAIECYRNIEECGYNYVEIFSLTTENYDNIYEENFLALQDFFENFTFSFPVVGIITLDVHLKEFVFLYTMTTGFVTAFRNSLAEVGVVRLPRPEPGSERHDNEDDIEGGAEAIEAGGGDFDTDGDSLSDIPLPEDGDMVDNEGANGAFDGDGDSLSAEDQSIVDDYSEISANELVVEEAVESSPLAEIKTNIGDVDERANEVAMDEFEGIRGEDDDDSSKSEKDKKKRKKTQKKGKQ